ncbi:hypothetical protein [Mycobacterium sp. SMC-4]|uniref:hypothetical protein n=1 Tax=Mycobacterium sp. SMC-4 TaxID=2857059 RepID=UPI0021B4A7D2|nr:hypothetical protein [Mycobacterium sp. SMC-4]UXA17724.1 hypothetical protein KXD98_23985 [Mycobacterium sp. SMC-4]
MGRRPLTECFLGTQIGTEAELFIKVLHTDTPGVCRNFLREIDLLTTMSGRPGFPVLRACSRVPGAAFHACDRLHAPRFDQCARDGRLEIEVLGELMCGLARWLQRLHAFGYVHRDLSPDHVFSGQQITVVDFGLARSSHELAADDRRRCIGSDVQALGLILWEMICGQQVFTYRSPVLALEIPPQLALIESLALPPPIARTLVGCLTAQSEMTPRIRPQAFESADDIVAALGS